MTRLYTVMRRLSRPVAAAAALLPAPAAWAQVPETSQAHHAAIATAPLSAGSLLQVTLGLAAVVITIFALAWFVRRYGRFQSSTGGTLRIIGGLSVGPREKIVLVQVYGRQLVLGVAPGRVQMLHALEGVQAPPVEAPSEAPAKPGVFAALLNRRGS